MPGQVRPELSDRAARMVLTCVVEAGDPTVAAMIAECGAPETWARVCESAMGEPLARRAASIDHRRIEVLSRHYKIRFVVPGDDEWPTGLDDLRFVGAVQRRAGVPIGLWLRGPAHLADLAERAVAIVGSRAATPYGSETAANLAHDLAERGVTIVSGGAYGIDASAHQGALAAGGSTVAVLANGVDVSYPKGNASLLGAIAEAHLIVSELPPGETPSRIRFLARNRMIAAASRGTVVVEAAVRSGARNTATWAVDCGRQLMAVPGPVYSAMSEGPHQLVRDGKASLITTASDALELVSAVGMCLPPAPRGAERPTDALDECRLSVFEALPSRSYAAVEDIADRAGLTIPSTLAELAALERDGMAEREDRGWRTSRPPTQLRLV